jgi:hypothetical protein
VHGIGIGNSIDDKLRFGLIENEHRARQTVSGLCKMFLKDSQL